MFSDMDSAAASGPTKVRYWTLPAGTVLPHNLGVVDDGGTTVDGHKLPQGHVSIVPLTRMPFTALRAEILSLSWQNTGLVVKKDRSIVGP